MRAKLDESHIPTIKEMVTKHRMSQAKIAKRLEVCAATVSRFVEKHGLPKLNTAGPGPLDVQGKTFNDLTAIERVGSNKNHNIIWRCKCKCGNETEVTATDLVSGRVKSCGCRKKNSPANKKELIGRTFNLLTAVEEVGRSKRGEALWRCSCSRGGEKIVVGNQLTAGRVKSCGCLRRGPRGPRIDKAGKQYGILTVVEYAGGGLWRCKCECGNEVKISSFKNRKSCGCMHSYNNKGARYVGSDGYVRLVIKYLSKEDQRLAKAMTKDASIKEHRLIGARRKGRPLKSTEAVHHLNGDKQDDRPENLRVLASKKHLTLIPTYKKRIAELETQVEELQTQVEELQLAAD